ncbi:MAG: ABC transporter ATP-binding protein [Thermoplasmatota archaeon]
MTLVLEKVTRRFGDVVALNRVDFALDAGITALVGANGSGKSTIMKVATGHVRPTSGQVTVFGDTVWDNPAVLRRIGYVPEQDAFYEQMTGLAFVSALAELSGLSPHDARAGAAAELDALGLKEGLDRPIKTYSKGMRQRVKLAQALVHRPNLLLLDEPLLGCDPIARRRLQDRIIGLRNEGCTVLVSTHILQEVEQLTRDVAILAGGRLVARGTMGEVRNALTRIPSRVRVYCEHARKAAIQLAGWPVVQSVELADTHVDVRTPDLQAFLERLQERPAGWGLTGHELLDGDLESLFGYVAGAAA